MLLSQEFGSFEFSYMLRVRFLANLDGNGESTVDASSMKTVGSGTHQTKPYTARN